MTDQIVVAFNEARAAIQNRIVSLRSEADALEAELAGNTAPVSSEALGTPVPTKSEVVPGSGTDRVLQFLLRRPGATTARVAQHMREPRKDSASRLRKLEKAGLVRRDRKTFNASKWWRA